MAAEIDEVKIFPGVIPARDPINRINAEIELIETEWFLT
jgi:hypothetical protein